MHLPLTLLSLLGLSLHVQAQAQNAAGLINALQQADLTTLASALERANRSEAGQRLISALVDTSKNHTVFAPDNAAFQAPAAATIGDNPEELASVLSYHVLQGNFVNGSTSNTSLNSAVFPIVTAGRTLLTNSTVVNLEGGKGQVLAWSRNGTSQVFFLNQSPRVVVRNSTAVGNLLVSVVSGVLIPPGSLDQVLNFNNLSSVAGVFSSVDATFYSNGTNTTVLEALESESTRGFTLFAPTDAAISAAGTQIRALSVNATAALALLGNHYINGTSYYSPTLLQSSSSSSFVSESGQAFTFSTNSSGAYVTSGNSTAKIIKSDVLVRNGVIHVIDNVLFNVANDDSKADSAYHSATSVAGQSATGTGPIGPTATSTSGNGSGSTGGNGKANGAIGAFSLGVIWGAVFGSAWIAFCWLG